MKYSHLEFICCDVNGNYFVPICNLFFFILIIIILTLFIFMKQDIEKGLPA